MNHQTRLAAETAEEREARLQQMSANQQERLAAETAEERPGYSVTERGTENNSHSQVPLFEQPSVRATM